MKQEILGMCVFSVVEHLTSTPKALGLILSATPLLSLPPPPHTYKRERETSFSFSNAITKIKLANKKECSLYTGYCTKPKEMKV
jgi:hypothetical protein